MYDNCGEIENFSSCEEIAKDCLLTGQEQACTRITFGRSLICLGVTKHHGESG